MTIKVGDKFSADYADGRYEFTVTEVIDGRVVLAEADTIDWGLLEKAFTVRDVEFSMKQRQVWDEHSRRHTAFWDTVPLGSTIHYHDGFGQYVRGVVIEDDDGKRLLSPTAMVGKWDHGWEYQWAKLVLGTGAWQPSASCVYESSEFVPPRGKFAGENPHDLEPLDFSGRESDYLDYLLRASS